MAKITREESLALGRMARDVIESDNTWLYGILTAEIKRLEEEIESRQRTIRLYKHRLSGLKKRE